MANEIKSSMTLTVTKGNASFSRTASDSIDMAGTAQFASQVVSVPTTSAGTAVNIGVLTTAGQSQFKNLDSTNYVEIGVQVGGTFYPLAKLLPGKTTQLYLATNTFHARSNTAACLLDYSIAEA